MTSSIFDKVISRTIEIQQIPAPTFEEAERAKFIHQKFVDENLVEVEIDEDNNVFGKLKGEGKSNPIILSAHLDTVFSSNVNLEVRKEDNLIFAPGIGDNSLALAGLFGILWQIKKQAIKFSGDIWFVANVGEEGLGDLKGMKKIVSRFSNKPLAYIVLEGMAYGVIFHEGIGVKRFRITLKTKGGHSWINYGDISAIHQAANLINSLLSLQLEHDPKTTINVGVISGGTSINTIAQEASFELDLRSESDEVVIRLADEVLEIIKTHAKEGLTIDVEKVGDRPAGGISANHPLVQIAVKSLAEQGVTAILVKASTDANIPLSLGYPSICIGIGNGGNAHTTDEFIQTDNIENGISHVLQVIEETFNLSNL